MAAIVALSVAVLAACGDSEDFIATEAEGASGTVLGSAHTKCADPVRVMDQYGQHEEALLPGYLHGFMESQADDGGVEPVAYYESLLSEMAVYNAEEDTLALRGAYTQVGDDEDLSPLGLLGAVVTDCVFEELALPERVQTHIQSTRALDGTLSDSWEDLEARWTYHPDNGLAITLWRSA